MTQTAAAAHSSEPQWHSGGVLRGTSTWSAYTDYRWQCTCGHRYGNATVVDGDVGEQHRAHLLIVNALPLAA